MLIRVYVAPGRLDDAVRSYEHFRAFSETDFTEDLDLVKIGFGALAGLLAGKAR